ncbi:MAG: M15 family metallopeptidase [Bacillota bacterium]|jgi:D-alanyl-D-alanine carboxypeptidase
MIFFKEHKQLFLNVIFCTVLLSLLGVGVYAQAEPAEEQIVGKSEDDTVGGAEKQAVQVNETVAVAERESEAYANCYALQNLDLVDWDNDGVVYPERLQTVANNAEGIAFALRLQNKEAEVFAHKDDPEYDPPANCDYPEWGERYMGYAIHENMAAADCDGTADLQGDVYAQWLTEALAAQGFAADVEDFSQYAGQVLTYETLGDMTYKALRYTKEENGKTVSLADLLVDEGIIQKEAAVIADLPVFENTEQTYEALFVKSLEEDSRPFLYTEKNKALMARLMADKTSHFALINQQNTLEADFVPQLTGSGNVQMEPVAYENLQELLQAAETEGLTVNPKSGYRSYGRQIQLYGAGENDYRAAPGTSEHQSGLAMDVVNAAGTLDESLSDSAEAKWLADNCWKYGFIIRYTSDKEDITGYPAEWWHVRYVGKTLAYELHSTGMTLEEFYQACLAGTADETAGDTAAAESENTADPEPQVSGK